MRFDDDGIRSHRVMMVQISRRSWSRMFTAHAAVAGASGRAPQLVEITRCD
jgi:hypothetical protein